jgi:hypothetical protein
MAIRRDEASPMPPEEPLILSEWDMYFCANECCALHVRAGDPGVRGAGNWARLPDGRTVGRSRYSGRVLCDFCGREELRTGAMTGVSLS